MSQPIILHLLRNPAWFRYQNKIVAESAVLLDEMFDIHPAQGVNKHPVFDAETVMTKKCDKNFVYYQVRKERFPSAKELWMDNHPDDILPEIIKKFDRVLITDRFKHQIDLDFRCSPHLPWHKFQMITTEDFKAKLAEYEVTVEPTIQRLPAKLQPLC